MSRQLGIIERADGTLQYFAHCGTSGVSFRRLFVTPLDARKVYGAGGDPAYLLQAPACEERGPEVVRVAIAYGWTFDGGDVMRCEMGIASGTRLISPWNDALYDGRYGLQLAGGVLHLSDYCGGGFEGDYFGPVCDRFARYNPDAKDLSLDDLFGRDIAICEACLVTAGASSDTERADAPGR
jgi:hypothetical protein